MLYLSKESFAKKNNPVSQAMDGMIVVLESLGLAKEQEDLEGFYESVRVRADGGIDNLQAKQDIIVQLYDKFFKVVSLEQRKNLNCLSHLPKL